MIVLDTHALVWLCANLPQLGPRARRAVDGAWQAGQLAVSAISFWEIATLQRKGRLELRADLLPWRAELIGMGLNELPLSGDVAASAGAWSDFPGDPADRLILATALAAEARVCTADRRMLQRLPARMRCDARV